MLAVEASVKLPCPTVIETGFGITCGTELAGAISADAGVLPAICAARETGRPAARHAVPAITMSHERRQPRTLLAHRGALAVVMNPAFEIAAAKPFIRESS